MTAKAVVVGAGGGIGAAVARELAVRDYAVHTVSRSQVSVEGCGGQHWCSDYSESSIDAVAQAIAESPGSLERLVITNGILHGEGFRPERALEHIDAGVAQEIFQVNTLLPMRWLAAFSGALKQADLPRIAVLSARVGSIDDNRLGGWYSYRASKAALNMMLKSASVEFSRRNKRAQLIAFHPGTVDTALSEPFQRGVPEDKLFSPSFVAQRLTGLMDEVPTSGDLLYLDWDGKPIPY